MIQGFAATQPENFFEEWYESNDECEQVEDRASFLDFIRRLARDYEEKPEEWENLRVK